MPPFQDPYAAGSITSGASGKESHGPGRAKIVNIKEYPAILLT